MSKKMNKTAEPDGKPTMSPRRILLPIFTAALIAAAAMACSGTIIAPAEPTADSLTATEQTGTAPPTSVTRTMPQERQSAPLPEGETTATQPRQTEKNQPIADNEPTPAKAGANAAGSQSGDTVTIEDILENGLANVGASPVHLALRATPVTESTRCQWRGIARTLQQRADTVRMLLNLQEDDEVPHPEYLSFLFEITADTIQPDLPTILKSNFDSIARGGISEEFLLLTCFIDYTITEYLLGSGPDTLTLAFDNLAESPSYNLYQRAHTAGDYAEQTLLTQEEHQAKMLDLATAAGNDITGHAGTNESIIFLAPMGAHNAIAIEAWQSVALWPLQDNDDGTFSLTRTELPISDPDRQITLTDLKARITAAAATDNHADSRIANASGLNQYYRDIGAYDDITPDDGSDQTFMPAMPPLATTCAGSTAVGTDPDQGLIDDCNALLTARDTLAGTATLNWSKDLAMASWDGIRLGGSPQRVHYILLTDQELDGNIPAYLGDLTELRRIDLDENDLTSHIPPQLGNLKKLTHLYLFDNQLSGEIPPELAQMTSLQVLDPADNDLTGQVPEEIGNLSNLTQLVLAENQLSGPLPDSLGQLTNLAHLKLRDNNFTGQIPRSLSALYIQYLGLSGNAFTGCLPTNLETGGNDDLFRPELQALPTCGPAFGEDSYAFTVASDAAAGTTVGTITATPYETGDAVTYQIAEGNDAGLFAINAATGAITTATAFTGTDGTSFTMTVTATDPHSQTANVEVSVTLTTP